MTLLTLFFSVWFSSSGEIGGRREGGMAESAIVQRDRPSSWPRRTCLVALRQRAGGLVRVARRVCAGQQGEAAGVATHPGAEVKGFAGRTAHTRLAAKRPPHGTG
jgi:hypothetical protein